jgi:hypothetical protein
LEAFIPSHTLSKGHDFTEHKQEVFFKFPECPYIYIFFILIYKKDAPGSVENHRRVFSFHGYASFSLNATVPVNKTKKALIDHALLKPDIAC